MTDLVSIADIEEARGRIAGIVKPTPLIRRETLCRTIGAEVWLKPENLQKTGSFKIGAPTIESTTLTPAEAARGVIAASAGNHGQALACAATRAGIKATIVMPKTAAIAKIDATRGYGQEVVLAGIDYPAARAAAHALREQTQAVFVDAYDDPYVIAGQGTIGLEIVDELTPEVVMVPVGGGGLIAGIATAVLARAPEAEIIGVEAAGSPQLSASLAAGTAVALDYPVDTIADGLATGRIGKIPFELIRGRVKRVVTVDDFEIGEAMLLLLERMKLLTESAGAAALAGALKIKNELQGRRGDRAERGQYRYQSAGSGDRLRTGEGGPADAARNRSARPSGGATEAAGADRGERRERAYGGARSAAAGYPDWERARDDRTGDARPGAYPGNTGEAA